MRTQGLPTLQISGDPPAALKKWKRPPGVPAVPAPLSPVAPGAPRGRRGAGLGWAGGSDSTTQVTLRLSSSISPIGHHSGTSADGVLSVPSAGRRVLSEAVPEPSPALRLATPRRARWHPRSQARRPEGRGGVRGRPRALRLRPPRSSTARPCLPHRSPKQKRSGGAGSSSLPAPGGEASRGRRTRGLMRRS